MTKQKPSDARPAITASMMIDCTRQSLALSASRPMSTLAAAVSSTGTALMMPICVGGDALAAQPDGEIGRADPGRAEDREMKHRGAQLGRKAPARSGDAIEGCSGRESAQTARVRGSRGKHKPVSVRLALRFRAGSPSPTACLCARPSSRRLGGLGTGWQLARSSGSARTRPRASRRWRCSFPPSRRC